MINYIKEWKNINTSIAPRCAPMKGYTSVSQYIRDHQLYRAARKVDPGRNGETLTSMLRKRIQDRLKHASAAFRCSGYTEDDLKFIATHEGMGTINSIDHFVQECFGKNYITFSIYRRLLRSKAFRSGRLTRLYAYLPHSIESKTHLTRFIKLRHGISKIELEAIMPIIGRGPWKTWIDEMIIDDKLHQTDGRMWVS
jgi:hypothetical protein